MRASHRLILAALIVAAEHLPRARTRGYLWELQRRLANAPVLDEQLEGAASGD